MPTLVNAVHLAHAARVDQREILVRTELGSGGDAHLLTGMCCRR